LILDNAAVKKSISLKSETIPFISKAIQKFRRIFMFKKAVFFVVIGLFCAANLFAQNTKGTITGTVLDPNGAVVPNVKVTATDTNRGVSQNVNSNEEGVFRFVSLEPSIYQIKVEMQGFAETLIEKIAVRVGETADVTATLRVNV